MLSQNKTITRKVPSNLIKRLNFFSSVMFFNQQIGVFICMRLIQKLAGSLIQTSVQQRTFDLFV